MCCDVRMSRAPDVVGLRWHNCCALWNWSGRNTSRRVRGVQKRMSTPRSNGASAKTVLFRLLDADDVPVPLHCRRDPEPARGIRLVMTAVGPIGAASGSRTAYADQALPAAHLQPLLRAQWTAAANNAVGLIDSSLASLVSGTIVTHGHREMKGAWRIRKATKPTPGQLPRQRQQLRVPKLIDLSDISRETEEQTKDHTTIAHSAASRRIPSHREEHT